MSLCPWCGKDNPLAASPGDPEAVPSPGDASLCIGCGKIGIFTEDGIRKPTESETAELAADWNMQQMAQAWQAVRQ